VAVLLVLLEKGGRWRARITDKADDDPADDDPVTVVLFPPRWII
jgi:hypothetical protein